jgi:hypothetical protein
MSELFKALQEIMFEGGKKQELGKIWLKKLKAKRRYQVNEKKYFLMDWVTK